MIPRLDEHLAALYRLRRFGIKPGLDTISRLMRGLGNPQDRYSCIHVAGTNGKGSIAAMLSSVLVRAGYRVGLYTSPHLVRFNERIRINGCPVSDADVAKAAETVEGIYTQSAPPTFFECATAMAFYLFAVKKVDWAVVETGMGGRYDATNILTPQVGIISNIAIEHPQYLGNTLAKIAAEKAGIIKRGTGVVTGCRKKKALKVIERAAGEKGALLRRLGKEIKIRRGKEGFFTYLGSRYRWDRLKVGLSGDHQVTNAAVALGALELLIEKGLKIPEKAIYSGLSEVCWPGRLEIVSKNPLVLLDGAHNPAAIRTLKTFLENGVACRRLTLVVGILKDKQWKTMARYLAHVADRIILTRPEYERAINPDQMASYLRNYKHDPVVVPHVADAILLALNDADDVDAVCVTGSLYTVGEARAFLARHYRI